MARCIYGISVTPTCVYVLSYSRVHVVTPYLGCGSEKALSASGKGRTHGLHRFRHCDAGRWSGHILRAILGYLKLQHVHFGSWNLMWMIVVRPEFG